ncbi:spermine/spermidine synthase domain-containing protein [Hydrogenimonas sp.]
MVEFRQQSDAADAVVYRVDRIVAEGKTPYQNYLFFENEAHGLCIAIDGDIQSCQKDEALYHEALVHPALLWHPEPEKVLIMGGGEGATAREVLRHDCVKKCVMVDIDGEFVEACRRHAPTWSDGAFEDERLELLTMDINAYIRETDERFDVVIGDLVDVADWEGFLATLYSDTFYDALKKILAPGAIVATQAGMLSPANHTSHLHVRRGLSAAFGHIRSYGAYVPSFYSLWGYVLASDAPLEGDLAAIAQTVAPRASRRGERVLEKLGAEGFTGLFALPAWVESLLREERDV